LRVVAEDHGSADIEANSGGGGGAGAAELGGGAGDGVSGVQLQAPEPQGMDGDVGFGRGDGARCGVAGDAQLGDGQDQRAVPVAPLLPVPEALDLRAAGEGSARV
jgi:hypothetical protein